MCWGPVKVTVASESMVLKLALIVADVIASCIHFLHAVQKGLMYLPKVRPINQSSIYKIDCLKNHLMGFTQKHTTGHLF